MEYIHIDDVAKVEIKAGHILSAESIEGSDKLLKLSVDFGMKKVTSPKVLLDDVKESAVEIVEEKDIRTVLSGIAKYFPSGEGLVGRKCAFVTNLAPRDMMGLQSQAMILGFNTHDHFSLMNIDDTVPPGTCAK